MEFFENAVLFSREFVDKYHHYKEEHQLFMQLAQQAGGIFDAQIDALRHQHEHGREHIARIAENVDGYLRKEHAAATTLVESIAAYGAMLRQHIHKEDHGFYPLAQRILTQDDEKHLEAEFRKADEKWGEDFMDKSRDRVLKMEALLRIPPRAEA